MLEVEGYSPFVTCADASPEGLAATRSTGRLHAWPRLAIVVFSATGRRSRQVVFVQVCTRGFAETDPTKSRASFVVFTDGDYAERLYRDRPLGAAHEETFGIVGVVDSAYDTRGLDHVPVVSVHCYTGGVRDGVRAGGRNSRGSHNKMVVGTVRIEQSAGLVPE